MFIPGSNTNPEALWFRQAIFYCVIRTKNNCMLAGLAHAMDFFMEYYSIIFFQFMDFVLFYYHSFPFWRLLAQRFWKEPRYSFSSCTQHSFYFSFNLSNNWRFMSRRGKCTRYQLLLSAVPLAQCYRYER